MKMLLSHYQLWNRFVGGFLVFYLSGCSLLVRGGPVSVLRDQGDIKLGSCVWVGDRKCPDKDVKFYLFTNENKNDRQFIYVEDKWENSNLSASNFNPDRPTKVIMHGFNSDMYLSSIIEMKDEYFLVGNYNIFYVDYSDLARGPCYLQAVHNIRHVGRCLGQLLDRILEFDTKDIHLIGFSLGAQLANFASIAVRPLKIPRITGLDPALPLFFGVPSDDKLDPSDAKFVDVYHSNALIQGQVEQCGHVDFYFNGGILQPGCGSWKDSPVGCSHNRAPLYYMESIRSKQGFWGWPCNSYVTYLLRLCRQSSNLFLAGEDVKTSTRGMHFIKTRSESPFAMGRYQTRNMFRFQTNDYLTPAKRRDPLLEELDQWGKLDGAFNNIDQFPTPLPQDPMDDWGYFGEMGPSQITQQNNYYYTPGNGDEGPAEGEVIPPDSFGPYGVEVLDVLHRKQALRKRPTAHRLRTKTRLASGNSTTEGSHFIEKLFEDYNRAESRASVPYWRRRPLMSRGKYDERFYTIPGVRRPVEDRDYEEDYEN